MVVIIYDNGLIRAMQSDGAHWNRDIANQIRNRAMASAPSSSGALRASHQVDQNRLHGRFDTGFSISAGNGLPDARAVWIHGGTGLYGPTGMPILPRFTPERKFLHMPPGMGFRWTSTTVLAGGPRKRRKGVKGPYVRILDPSDPYGHAESSSGTPANPWLRNAGYEIAFRHAAT